MGSLMDVKRIRVRVTTVTNVNWDFTKAHTFHMSPVFTLPFFLLPDQGGERQCTLHFPRLIMMKEGRKCFI